MNKKEDVKPEKAKKGVIETVTPIIVGTSVIGFFEPTMAIGIGLFSVAGWCGVKIIDILKGSTEEERQTWNEFFDATGIKTGSDERPLFAKKVETKKGHKYIFKSPIGFSTHNIKQKETSIKEFLGAKHIESEITGEWLTIEATETQLPRLVKFEIIPSKKDRLEVTIGKTLEGYAKIDFSAMPHTLISGATGSGKSGVTHSILTQLACNYQPHELHLYLADLKRVELIKYKDLKITKSYVKTVEETEILIDKMLEICEDRYEKMENIKVNKIDIYNKRVDRSEKLPYIVVCIEECVRLVSNKELQNKLSELLYISRACGIYIILTIQRPTKSNISPEIKSSLGNIIGLQTVNKRNSEAICDDDRLKALNGRGHAWLMKDNTEEEFQSFYLNDETDEIDKILKENCKLK